MGNDGEIHLKTKFSPNPEILSTKLVEKEDTLLLNSIKIECDVCHRWPIKIAKTERNLPLLYNQVDTTYYIHVLKIS